ncbi:MAG: coproporphyrinogen III oxidase [Rhodobacteraceae bacterium]|nr:coproporphyrinogen III oxidase [Paracoccaceae bacterium]
MNSYSHTSPTEDWQNGGFGIYIHWPFCAAKCPYCDFNSHVVSSIDEDRWRTAYLKEIDRTAQLTGQRSVRSIFIGGGTPSLMSPSLVGALLEKIASVWRLEGDCEISLEANPTSVEAERLRGFRAAGVNRVSMGIQSLNDQDLKRLGRLHTAQEALKSFDIAQNIFERTSFDLIYARQHQSLSQWENELKQALSLGLNHMSLYQLTIEAGTAFGDRYEKGNLKGLPDEDLASDLFEMTRQLCDAEGLRAYEVSNHAKSGHECRHNLVYWNYGDYAGIGPGAHGRLTLDNVRYSTDTHKQPAKWLTEVENGSGDSSVSPLSLAEQGTEMVLMGMRLSTGISKNRFQSLFGTPPSDTVLKELASQGFITIEGEQIMATRAGTLLLNHLVGQLLLSIP